MMIDPRFHDLNQRRGALAGRFAALLAGLALALSAGAGCFNPKTPDVAFRCGAGGECPDGYECRPDGCCHRVGSADDGNSLCSPGADGGVGDGGVAPDLFSFTPGDAVMSVGDSATYTITLDAPATTGGQVVTLTSSAPGVATIDAQVTVAAGQSMATANVSAVGPGTALLTATMGTQSLTATVSVAARTAQPGDVVITEFHALPSGGGNTGEFIEIVNVSATPLDISGWTFDVNGGSDTILAATLAPSDPVYLRPGEARFGIPNPSDPGTIPAGPVFLYGSAGSAFEIADAGDHIRLRDTGGEIDAVDFTGWLTTPGATPGPAQFGGLTDRSTQLDAERHSAVDNDDGGAWCVPARPTPGAANPPCRGVTINELFPDAYGADDRLEFIELRVIPGATLGGLRLRGTDAAGAPTGADFTFPAATRAPLRDLFLIGDNTGGGTLVAGADLEASLGLPDAGGAVQVLDATTLRDVVGYGSLTATVDTVDGLSIVETGTAAVAMGASIARDATGTDSGNNGVDFRLDPSPTPGAENDGANLQLLSITPGDALATVGASVTLVGNDFVSNATILVDGTGVSCTIASATTADCTFPAHAVGAVGVSIRNPGGATATMSPGFVYTGVLADPGASFTCQMVTPNPPINTTVGNATRDILATVFSQGATDTVSATAAAGIDVQLGYGADASDPTAVNWTWVDAFPDPNYDFSGTDDQYLNQIIPDTAGAFDVAFRVSLDGGVNWYYCDEDGSDNGYASAQSGTLNVN